MALPPNSGLLGPHRELTAPAEDIGDEAAGIVAGQKIPAASYHRRDQPGPNPPHKNKWKRGWSFALAFNHRTSIWRSCT